jgi:hypothetical protein
MLAAWFSIQDHNRTPGQLLFSAAALFLGVGHFRDILSWARCVCVIGSLFISDWHPLDRALGFVESQF